MVGYDEVEMSGERKAPYGLQGQNKMIKIKGHDWRGEGSGGPAMRFNVDASPFRINPCTHLLGHIGLLKQFMSSCPW
jgi:hypothetical protein